MFNDIFSGNTRKKGRKAERGSIVPIGSCAAHFGRKAKQEKLKQKWFRLEAKKGKYCLFRIKTNHHNSVPKQTQNVAKLASETSKAKRKMLLE
jgi:hypothetical protein